MIDLIYTVLLAGGLLALSPVYLLRRRAYRETVPDRLGRLRFPKLRRSIWVHAVSVGEVRAVEKLLERLRTDYPDTPIVVSTTTLTGQELAKRRADVIDHCFYFPFDLPWCVNRALDHVDPALVIIAETEIWPNFMRACGRRGVQVCLVNGRISDVSFERYRLLRAWFAKTLRQFTVVGMQSERDRQRIETLGAPAERTRVFGNLKFDAAMSTSTLKPDLDEFLTTWKPIWFAASTMPGEDEIILDVFEKVRKTAPQLKLLLAPRHPERCGDVEQLLHARHLRFHRRSRLSEAPVDVLLLDTIGELSPAYVHATAVFVGGSLVPRGGHNILEPARWQKPITFGPHMNNFRDVTSLFLAEQAAIQAQDADELASALTRLLSEPMLAADFGRRAGKALQAHVGATSRFAEFIRDHVWKAAPLGTS